MYANKAFNSEVHLPNSSARIRRKGLGLQNNLCHVVGVLFPPRPAEATIGPLDPFIPHRRATESQARAGWEGWGWPRAAGARLLTSRPMVALKLAIVLHFIL